MQIDFPAPKNKRIPHHARRRRRRERRRAHAEMPRVPIHRRRDGAHSQDEVVEGEVQAGGGGGHLVLRQEGCGDIMKIVKIVKIVKILKRGERLKDGRLKGGFRSVGGRWKVFLSDMLLVFLR